MTNRRHVLQKQMDYFFKNEELLREALTHSSYANERGSTKNYERLEFLGDAVLELLVSDLLFHEFPQMSEGDLTKMRASMVCETALAQIARNIGLPAHMLLGNGEEQTGGRDRESILADELEAVIGGVFLDGGFASAKKMVANLMNTHVTKNTNAMLNKDYKTQLQEILQRNSVAPIVYEIMSENGPDHLKCFRAQVCHEGRVLGIGQGRTKKEAEQEAAFDAMNS